MSSFFSKDPPKKTERDPVSVGFLHTPNFAAFWPKPRKKRILGQCAGIMQTVLHLTPPLQMSGSCPKPKKTSRKDSGTMCWYHANSSPPYPPCRCQAPVPKPKKTSRNRKILSKTQKNLEKSKKTKNTKDSGTMCWYHVNILLARLVFLVFFRFLEVSFGFGQNLSISRCFFDFGWFLSNSQCFFDFGHLLLISRCF